MEKKNKIGILIGIILGIIVLGFIIFITLSFIFSNEKELKTMVNGDSTAENDDTTQIINSIKDDTINLKNIYEEANMVWKYSLDGSNSTFASMNLTKYFNGYMVYKDTNVYTIYSQDIDKLKKSQLNIKTSIQNLSNKKQSLIDLYSAYEDFSNSATSFPENYSYMTYATTMKGKYDNCMQLITKAELDN